MKVTQNCLTSSEMAPRIEAMKNLRLSTNLCVKISLFYGKLASKRSVFTFTSWFFPTSLMNNSHKNNFFSSLSFIPVLSQNQKRKKIAFL